MADMDGPSDGITAADEDEGSSVYDEGVDTISGTEGVSGT
jgi:hypothetical protein